MMFALAAHAAPNPRAGVTTAHIPCQALVSTAHLPVRRLTPTVSTANIACEPGYRPCKQRLPGPLVPFTDRRPARIRTCSRRGSPGFPRREEARRGRCRDCNTSAARTNAGDTRPRLGMVGRNAEASLRCWRWPPWCSMHRPIGHSRRNPIRCKPTTKG